MNARMLRRYRQFLMSATYRFRDEIGAHVNPAMSARWLGQMTRMRARMNRRDPLPEHLGLHTVREGATAWERRLSMPRHWIKEMRPRVPVPLRTSTYGTSTKAPIVPLRIPSPPPLFEDYRLFPKK